MRSCPRTPPPTGPTRPARPATTSPAAGASSASRPPLSRTPCRRRSPGTRRDSRPTLGTPTARPRSRWLASGLVPEGARGGLAARLRRQADWCDESHEPLYAGLLRQAAEDAEAGGPAWAVLEPHATEPGTAAVALRFLAGVRRLVLEGRLPELGQAYALGDSALAWPHFRAALVEHRQRLGDLVARPCQTNEVGRSAALLGGFLELAQ